MLQLVDIGRQAIGAYSRVVGHDTVEELRRLAKPLRGLRVLNINATPYGGGVSEMLRSLVPLENDLGLSVEWRIISGDEKFFKITKTIHDALQGESHTLNSRDREEYLTHNQINSREVNPRDYDVIIIHDPQPVALLDCCRDRGDAKWIWRCHIDTSEPDEAVWQFMRIFIVSYDMTVFTMDKFVPPDFPHPDVTIIPPAIDPLSPKNMNVPHHMAAEILSWLGMFPGEPFITQVSRFDKWKDPLGVIQVYRLVKEEMPDIHLALVGSMAFDDPTAWDIYSQLTKEDLKDPNLHVFTNLTGVSNIEVNAFQRLSKVAIQKSLREGFGLVVSEALWKGTPIVAGKAGGIPLQLSGGGGYLIESIEECAEKVTHLLKNPEEAISAGERGRDYIAKHFLITRLLKDEIMLFDRLIHS